MDWLAGIGNAAAWHVNRPAVGEGNVAAAGLGGLAACTTR